MVSLDTSRPSPISARSINREGADRMPCLAGGAPLLARRATLSPFIKTYADALRGYLLRADLTTHAQPPRLGQRSTVVC